MLDLKSIIDGRGLSVANLPASLLALMQGRRSAVMDRLTSAGPFGRISQGVLARRDLYPSLASLYYQEKPMNCCLRCFVSSASKRARVPELSSRTLSWSNAWLE